MRILMVSRHCCIRVFKQSLALIKKGHTVDSLAQQVSFGSEIYSSYQIYATQEQLSRSIEGSRADVIHVHNEPDWMVAAAKEAAGSRPVVYDVHDLDSMRWQRRPSKDETEAFEAADAIIHISQAIAARAHAEHPDSASKPTLELPCFASDTFLTDSPGSVGWSTLVYQGGVSQGKQLTDPERPHRTIPAYRNYLPVVEAAVEQGLHMHIYKGDQRIYPEYLAAHAVILGPLMYPTLMTALRSYGMGLVGSHYPNELMASAIPNKLFEYAINGVVPVLLNLPVARDYCRTFDLPHIYLDGLQSLPEQLAEAPMLRPGVINAAPLFTMEQHIQQVLDLYEEVL